MSRPSTPARPWRRTSRWPGLRPADRPAAVLDGDPTTGWVTQFDPRPVLEVAPRRQASARHALGSRCSRTVSVIPVSGCRPGWPCAPTPARRASTCPTSGRVEVRAARGGDRLRGRRGARHRPGPAGRGAHGPRRGPAGRHRRAGDGGGTGRARRARRGDPPLRRDFPARTGASIPRATSCASARALTTRRAVRSSPVGSRPLVGRRTRRPGRWSPHRGRPRSPGCGRRACRVRTSSSRSSALAARPDALVDGNEHTAWSPAPDDASPEISLTLDEPADIDAVVLHARRGWFAPLPPVRAGAPRRSGAAGPGVGGRPSRRARTGRADGLGQRPTASRPAAHRPLRPSSSRSSSWPVTTSPVPPTG